MIGQTNTHYIGMTRQSEEFKIRKDKLETARRQGNPFPARTNRSHTAEEVLGTFNELARSTAPVSVVGRIKTLRLHGGSCFCHIQDGSGTIQLYFKRDVVTAERYRDFTDTFDVGDFIEAQGSVFTTKKGEKTILVKTFRMLGKSLLPLPEKWHGLSDVETRFRQRYLDLIANPSVVDTFKKRAKIISVIRASLEAEGFLEVETPVLQTLPGGANARPFSTHHHALSTDLFLRIAPELFLKRLIVGGFEKVYEIARCFRNEGIDRDHNPEFTQVEFYAAYWDYRKMMEFTQALIQQITQSVHGSLQFTHAGNTLDFTKIATVTFSDAAKKYADVDLVPPYDEAFRKKLHAAGLPKEKGETIPQLLDGMFKHFIRPKLVEPTFVIDYPIEMSPLAKKVEGSEHFVERFQLVAHGIELCNAFSELNDPLDQLERFKGQDLLRKAGDEEAQRLDTEFVEALQYGMPPTAGIGIGIDRLTALLTDTHNIKEVILFPTLKPKSPHDG